MVKICEQWIVFYAAEKSKELTSKDEQEFNDVLSEYTHYTQKTLGKFESDRRSLKSEHWKNFHFKFENFI